MYYNVVIAQYKPERISKLVVGGFGNISSAIQYARELMTQNSLIDGQTYEIEGYENSQKLVRIDSI